MDPLELDPDAGGSPTRVPAPQVEGRLQERGLRPGVTPAGVIVGRQLGEGPIAGLRPRGAAGQVADRADGQVESPGDLRRGGRPARAGERGMGDGT